jgi:hypothetical protein
MAATSPLGSLGWDRLASRGRTNQAGGVAAVALPRVGDPHRIRLADLRNEAGGLLVQQVAGRGRQAPQRVVERLARPGWDGVQLGEPAVQDLAAAGGVVQVGGGGGSARTSPPDGR